MLKESATSFQVAYERISKIYHVWERQTSIGPSFAQSVERDRFLAPRISRSHFTSLFSSRHRRGFLSCHSRQTKREGNYPQHIGPSVGLLRPLDFFLLLYFNLVSRPGKQLSKYICVDCTSENLCDHPLARNNKISSTIFSLDITNPKAHSFPGLRYLFHSENRFRNRKSLRKNISAYFHSKCILFLYIR